MSEATKLPSLEDAIAYRIASYRRRIAYSQEDLAAEMANRGIAWSRATVAQVETRRRSVTAVELVVLAATLDVTVKELVNSAHVPGAQESGVRVGDGIWTHTYVQAAVDGTAMRLLIKEPGSFVTGQLIESMDQRSAHARESRKDWDDYMRRWGLESTTPDLPLPQSGIEIESQLSEAFALRLRRRTGFPVQPKDVYAAANVLWGHRLVDEREKRARVAVGLGKNLQASRGHASRAIEREIEDSIRTAFERQLVTPAPRTQPRRKTR